MRRIKSNCTNSLTAQAMQLPFIDGAFINGIAWSSVEPSEGVFDWSEVDALIAKLASFHKKVSLDIWAGRYSPDWLYAEGAAVFNTVVEIPRANDFCQPMQLPVPWDPIYMAEMKKLIAAFGEHYDNNPNVALVKMTGIEYRTDELTLPSGSGNIATSASGLTCQYPNDIANWISIGYTDNKIYCRLPGVSWRTLRVLSTTKRLLSRWAGYR